MANGTTRLALAQMKLKNAQGTEELNEEMSFDKTQGQKMPLKASDSPHNHSSDSFRTRK